MPETAPPRPDAAAHTAEQGASEYHAVEIGAGRPVVFVHDVYGSASDWGPVMEALSDDWRCLAFDLPGHGRTTPVEDSADLDSVALDFCAAVTDFDACPGVLVAHGASALIVLRMCAIRPEVATALALVSPGVAPLGPGTGGEPPSPSEDWFANAFGDQFFVEQPGRAAEERARVGQLDVRAATSLHRLLASPEALATLRADRAELPSIPTLVIGSMRDRLVPASLMDELGRRLEADVEFMPRGGHMLPVERPEQVTTVLRSFLEGL